MISHVDVEMEISDLEKHVYRFWVNYPYVMLDYYWHYTRATKRHKFVAQGFWSRTQRRKNTVRKPMLSQAVRNIAMDKARSNMNLVEPE